MTILILGGNNPDNQPWVHGLGQRFSQHFPDVLVHEYKHWSSDQGSIDIDHEITRLQATVGNHAVDIVFAKSAGTIVALRAILGNIITPSYVVLVGTPISWAETHGIDLPALLTTIKIPVLFIQHIADPTISADNLKQLINSQPQLKATFLELPGDSHSYPELDQLVAATVEFTKQN